MNLSVQIDFLVAYYLLNEVELQLALNMQRKETMQKKTPRQEESKVDHQLRLPSVSLEKC